MGEVWKSRDTRLDRIVAIKGSEAEFSNRFAREAKGIAASRPSLFDPQTGELTRNGLSVEVFSPKTLSGCSIRGLSDGWRLCPVSENL